MKATAGSHAAATPVARPRRARIVTSFTLRAVAKPLTDAPLILMLLAGLALALGATTLVRVRAEATALRATAAAAAATDRALIDDVLAGLFREQAATRAAVILGRELDRNDVRAARAGVHAALGRLSERAAAAPALERAVRATQPEILALEDVFDRELRFAAQGDGARARAWFTRDRVFAEWVAGALTALAGGATRPG